MCKFHYIKKRENSLQRFSVQRKKYQFNQFLFSVIAAGGLDELGESIEKRLEKAGVMDDAEQVVNQFKDTAGAVHDMGKLAVQFSSSGVLVFAGLHYL